MQANIKTINLKKIPIKHYVQMNGGLMVGAKFILTNGDEVIIKDDSNNYPIEATRTYDLTSYANDKIDYLVFDPSKPFLNLTWFKL